MKDWKETLLTDVTSKIGDGLHGTPKYDNEGEYYFINGNNLVDGKIIIKTETKKVNKSEFLKHQKPLSSNTILLGINGTFGNVAFYNNEKCILGKSACYINVNEKVDKKFLYYNFLNNDFQLFLESIATGTTIPNVPLKGLREYSFILPTISEQQSIAEVLSSLDDKIDLLHRQNKTLEQMAETLFRQWFVEEAEDNWEEVRLDEIATIQNGYAFKSGEYVEFGIDTLEVFKMGHISPDGGLKSSPKKDFVPRNISLNRWIMNKRDIVLAMTDMKDNVVILGVPALIDKDDHYVLNQRVARIVLKPDTKVIDQLILYYYMSDSDFISTLQSKASSGVQVNLSTESIRESLIKIAPIKKQERAITILNDIAEKQENGRLQIGLLENVRDSLLPKLMNGSVRVINN